MRTEVKNRLRRAGCWLAVACLASVTAFADGDGSYEVRLLEGTRTPSAGVSQAEVRSLVERASIVRGKSATVHALVQLYRVPDESEREDLSRSGLDLGAYVPANSWVAAIPVDQVETAASRSEVRWIEPWTAGRKLHPRLKAGQVAPWARDPERPEWVMTMVLLHADVDLSRGAALAESVGGVATDPIETVHGLTIWVPERNLAMLADEEEVLWIEEGPAPLTPTNAGARGHMKVDPLLNAPYALNGEGVKLFVYDGGSVRESHPTFDAGSGSRVTRLDNSPYGDHPTHVAGTAAGDGSGSPLGEGRGVALLTRILSAGFQPTIGPILFWEHAADIEADYKSAIKGHRADLATNSLSSNVSGNGYPCDLEGNYGVSSALIDTIVRGAFSSIGLPSQTVMLWANSNERHITRCGANYHTTPEPSCAKNPIHVGAVNSDGGAMTWFSSWGPCDDGRLKPTVSAAGCETGRVSGNAEEGILSSVGTSTYAIQCGTSMATPAVAGALALLFEDWKLHGHAQPFGSTIPRPVPALFKAMVVHTAKDLGVDGPDYRFGYGAVDAKALIDLQRAGTGALGGSGLSSWGTDSVATGQNDSFSVTVPSGAGELKATLAWDDPAAAAFAAVALVNDLDLELVAPDNTVYRSWVLDPANPLAAATAGVNTLDNQEQVLVENPQAGVWTVRVLGTSVPTSSQSYGLVYTATPKQFGIRSDCSTSSASFESGNDGWTLTGATRVAAPGPGHGAFSIRLGGADNQIHEVQKSFSLPVNSSAILSFDAFMTTTEGNNDFGYDELTAEVRDLSGTVLAVVTFNNDGDLTSTWLPQRNIDLSPWAGTTVKLAVRATTDSLNPTTFWIDDVKLSTCAAAGLQVRTSFSSIAAQDGYVRESTETSNVGGAAGSNNQPVLGAPPAVSLGDSDSDQQFKTFFSFDTSALPDGATIVWARLRMRRTDVDGTNPFTTHGACRVDVRTGGFNGNVLLEPADFQAPATASQAAVCSDPFAVGSWSFATLNSAGLEAINKTGTTQFRLYFHLGDNDDTSSDMMRFSPGEEPTLSFRPQLEVVYLP